MKILYVLVSSESDFYYEQALISMMSAKYQMPDCTISLLTERETDSSLNGPRNLIKEYLSEKAVIDLDSSLSPMQKSRWLKTSMRDLIKGDFLYVDVDTVFAGPVDEALFTDDVMGVPDGNCLFSEHPLRSPIENNLKKANFQNSLKYHINSGVLYFRDSPVTHSFCRKWHQLWSECCKKGIFIDQPALHQAFIDVKLEQHLLPNFMNAQFGRNRNTLAAGIILHYYSSWTQDSSFSPAYKFLQKKWLKEFRESPKAEIFQKTIQNPKEAFDSGTYVMGENYNLWYYSQLIQCLATIFNSTDAADKRLYLFLEKVTNFISNYYYRIIRHLYPLYKLFKKSK